MKVGMNAQQLTAKLTAFIEGALSNPLGFLIWVIGTVAILGVASNVLAPLMPSMIRPHGQIMNWLYIAGFCYLMKGAGR
jgi:hypothetical protein